MNADHNFFGNLILPMKLVALQLCPLNKYQYCKLMDINMVIIGGENGRHYSCDPHPWQFGLLHLLLWAMALFNRELAESHQYSNGAAWEKLP